VCGCSTVAELRSAIDSAEQAVRQITRHAVGELRVSAPVFLGHQLVAYLERQLLRSNPQLTLNLVLDDARVDIIASGYDAAVRIGQEPSPSLTSERIGATRVVVCATPEFLAANGCPDTPQALSEFPCILQAIGLTARNQWDFVTADGPLAVTVDGPFRSNNDFAIRNAALASVGIAYIPSFVVATELASGELVSVLDEYSPRERQIYLVYPHQPHLPRKLEALRELLPGVMRSLGLG
jgi:DNA-binding transcriptional LysR family regulator